MDIIRPVAIADAQFVSSNVAENDYAVWSAATTYAAGTRVIVTASGDHHIYESLQASNLNHTPITSPTWWLDLGADNRWAMFDSTVSTVTSNANSINVVLNPGAINSLALLEIDAYSVDLLMVSASVTIYSASISLAAAYIYDWYSYFYEPITYKRYLVLDDLPQDANASLTVTINKNAATAKVGVFVVGLSSYIGVLLWRPTVGIIDYSTKETDTFGNTTIIKRAYSKRMSCELDLDNGQVDNVHLLLSSYRATPIVWVGTDLFEATIIFGFFKEFSIVIENYAGSTCTLDIEGLV